MKKLKNPGDNISLKTKKSEDPAIMDWINSQTNLMDSIRYLIENEVRQHGVRNLQSFIPADRSLAAAPLLSAAGQPLNAPAEQAAAARDEVAASRESVAEEAVEPQEPDQEEPVDDGIDEEDIESWL